MYWSPQGVDELGLKPMINVKKLLRQHYDNILTYF